VVVAGADLGPVRIESSGDLMIHVGHETIYQARYAQGCGELRLRPVRDR
jgi:hypothetical protein